MPHDIVVLGAGMVGVSAAWHLQARGHRVTLVDRCEPGRETSFGNAGIIQSEAVRPYAFPRDLMTLVRVLPNRRVDIRYRPGALVESAVPLLQYWRNSAPDRYERLVPEYAALIRRAQSSHAEMISAANADTLIRKEGYLEVFRTVKAFEAARQDAEQIASRFGVRFRALDAKALRRMEPNLTERLVGAIHWIEPWTAIDPGALVAAYAESFKALGGQLVRGSLQELSRKGEGWQATIDGKDVVARQVVLAMGPWSAQWLAKQGPAVPLFVKRGHHMHYAPRRGAVLTHWVLDAEVGYLLAPMRAGIRLTTGAELTAQESPPSYRQLAAAEAAAREFFPLGDRLDPTPWMGGRPCTPDMKPVIGPVADLPGLWVAFGHGHQGFTLGPVTGKLLGQMMDGETPDVDMGPYRVERF